MEQLDSVTLKIWHWEEVSKIKGSLLKLPDLILASPGNIGSIWRKLFKGLLGGELFLNTWPTTSALVMDDMNCSWDLASPKSHRVLGRLILWRASCRGMIVFQTWLWTWPILSRDSKPEHTTIIPAPRMGWGTRLSGKLREAFQSQCRGSRATSPLNSAPYPTVPKLLQAPQASPRQALLGWHCSEKTAPHLVWPFLNPQATDKDKGVRLISG